MNYSEALLTGKGVQLGEALSTGGLTTVVGLGIVFGVLLILMIVLCLFKVIFYKDPAKVKKAEAPVVEEVTETVKEETQDKGELIAILTAAVAASLNTSTYNLQIKSYRRVKDNRPSWNKEGLRETISNRF